MPTLNINETFDEWARWLCKSCMHTDEIFIIPDLSSDELLALIVEEHSRVVCNKPDIIMLFNYRPRKGLMND